MDKGNAWNKLKRGDVVQLRVPGAGPRQAIIDDFSEDRTLIWVRMEGLNERKLVLHDDEGIGILPANVR